MSTFNAEPVLVTIGIDATLTPADPDRDLDEAAAHYLTLNPEHRVIGIDHAARTIHVHQSQTAMHGYKPPEGVDLDTYADQLEAHGYTVAGIDPDAGYVIVTITEEHP